MNLFKFCSKKKKMPNSLNNGRSTEQEAKSSHQQLGISCHIDPAVLSSPPRCSTSNQVGTPSSDPEFITSTEVTIREPATEESTSISGVLRYCKHRILYPYLRLLGVMGLKPLGIPEAHDRWTCASIMNKIYIGIVSVLLLAGYVLQFLTCYRRDRGFIISSEFLPEHVYGFADQDNSTATCSGNPFCAHVIPSLLHAGSFLYMVYLYRINDDEQLPNLMERVFIQASHAHTSFFSQRRLLRTLQFLVIFSVIWIILSTGSQVLQITTHTYNINPWTEIRNDIKQTLIFILALSGLWQDAIQVAVIVSYSIHCYLLSTYFNLIHSRIQQHSITLPDCIKELGELDKLLNYLNNDLAPGLGPLMIMDLSYAVSSITFIIDKGRHLQILDLVSLVLIAVLWVIVVVLPFFQSAKLSTSCKRVRELGHLVRMRPFGYQDTPQTDLDSFLLFVSSLKMDVHICQIPISTPVLALITASALFILLMWGLILV